MLQITPERLELESAKGAIAQATFVATNRITTPVTISGITLAGETGLFVLTPPTLPMTLAPGESVAIPIQYDPSDDVLDPFVSNAYLVVVSDSGIITKAELWGRVSNLAGASAAATTTTATSPEAVANAAEAGITGDGSVVPDQMIINSFQGQPASGVFVITNPTGTPFAINSLVLAGDKTLSIVSPPALPLNVAANSSVQVEVKYDPPDQLGLPAFLARAALTVVTNQPNKLIRAAVIGRILNPESDAKSIAGSEITPRTLTLRSVQGAIATGKIAITNTTPMALTISKIDLIGDVGALTLNSVTLPLTIAANSSEVLTVTYQPPNVQNLPAFDNKAILQCVTNSGRTITAEIVGTLLTPQKLSTGDTLPGNDTVSVVLPPASSTEPPLPKEGDYWVDSSVTPPRVWLYDGFVWVGQTMSGTTANKFADDFSVKLDPLVQNESPSITGYVAPNTSFTVTPVSGAGTFVIGTYTYEVTFVYGTVESPRGPSVGVTTASASSSIGLNSIPLGPSGVTARRIYRTFSGQQRLITTLANNTTTSFSDANFAVGTIQSPPTDPDPVGLYRYIVTNVVNGVESLPTLVASRVVLPNEFAYAITIEVGPIGTTARRIYRADPNESQYRLVEQIPNNTATLFVDLFASSSGALEFLPQSFWDQLLLIPSPLPNGIKILSLEFSSVSYLTAGSDLFIAPGVVMTDLSDGVFGPFMEIDAPAPKALAKAALDFDDLYFFSLDQYPNIGLFFAQVNRADAFLRATATVVYAHVKFPILSKGAIT